MKEAALGIGISGVIFLAFMGINIAPVIIAGLLLGGFYFFLSTQGSIKYEVIKSNNKVRHYVDFADIGGQESAIKELKEALQFLLKPEEIAQMGIRPLKGILLVGPPGTGKTLLARAAAGYTDSAFIAVAGSEFIEMYAGVGAKRVRHLFREAKKKAREQNCRSAIIFIDELDVLGARRGSHTGHLEYDQTLNQLLVEMDGINPNEDPRILVIGATNRSDILDPALLRPGRFDRQVYVGLPDKEGRKKILKIHTRNKPLDDEEVLEEVARETFGFSGAHLESLANEAAILAMREGKEKIEKRHFIEAIDKVIMGEKVERRPSEEEVARVSIHEVGHALVSELLEPGSVATVTIVPRGRSLGYMRKSPDHDKYLYTREELEKQVMVALAGALAEEMKYGNFSTGAKGDFTSAWDMVKEIIASGLSSLGVINIEEVPEKLIYEESKNIIHNLQLRTREILEANKELLEIMAERIKEEEVLNRERFLKLMNN
ncbi:vesicle-fusing ATPase [Thermosyntropha lipolytica DSM 11003]|uniref:Vesicle-fusing ATPase n=1 Tax=Thermosyntropha lipolytica DSM 11003 TaxID=1123382 RepID=A0A1M5QEB8_9FIRM|nr:AAA family ATPase [Thermosyntropha lipolytica]SHH12515.1 vesicle-fusing ATPase [Thermosyntropha lipolytica DSM 11003]